MANPKNSNVGGGEHGTDKPGGRNDDKSQTTFSSGTAGASSVVGAVKNTFQEVATGALDWAGQAKDTATGLASSVAEAAGHAKDKAQYAGETAAETASDVGREMTAMIRRYPLQSLLIGVGVGFLLSQVSRRS